MKEGYLQTKIRELEGQLEKAEGRAEELLKKVELKEKELNNLISSLASRVKTGEELREQQKKSEEMWEKAYGEVFNFHKKQYLRVQKQINKQLNELAEELKKSVNHTINDHTADTLILQKLLIDKGILNPEEVIRYFDIYWEEFVKSAEEGEKPIRNLGFDYKAPELKLQFQERK